MVVNYQKILLPILKGLEVFKSFLLGVKHLLTSLEVGIFKCVVSVNRKGIALDLNRVVHVVLCGCHRIVASLNQGIAPWYAALTDSDLVAVTNAPVTMECVMLLRPVMGDALVSSCFICEVDNSLPTGAHDGSSNDHVGCNALIHGSVVCEQCYV